jgi:spore germination cell wall hydrolase CwlJ-like protein|tara:strand:+ start:197 stop:613 length:417 start_codon:yes stop_codon:yes gene_type:complete
MLAAVACMALALYFEARGEPVVGQIAVGHVISNRVADPRYPDTVCEVVMQGPTYSWKPDFPARHRCQFSFYCDGKSDKPKDVEAYSRAVALSRMIISGGTNDPSEGATHYHANYVLPSWASSKARVIRINDHVFYRWH